MIGRDLDVEVRYLKASCAAVTIVLATRPAAGAYGPVMYAALLGLDGVVVGPAEHTVFPVTLAR